MLDEFRDAVAPMLLVSASQSFVVVRGRSGIGGRWGSLKKLDGDKGEK